MEQGRARRPRPVGLAGHGPDSVAIAMDDCFVLRNGRFLTRILMVPSLPDMQRCSTHFVAEIMPIDHAKARRSRLKANIGLAVAPWIKPAGSPLRVNAARHSDAHSRAAARPGRRPTNPSLEE